MVKKYFKGDSIQCKFTANTDITDFVVRAMFYDHCNTIKVATANSGGSVDQIEIIDNIKGVFIVKVAKNLTTCFEDKTFLEIEFEDPSGNLTTVWNNPFPLCKEEITWETP